MFRASSERPTVSSQHRLGPCIGQTRKYFAEMWHFVWYCVGGGGVIEGLRVIEGLGGMAALRVGCPFLKGNLKDFRMPLCQDRY